MGRCRDCRRLLGGAFAARGAGQLARVPPEDAMASCAASIQLYADGPLLLRGDVQILDSEGREIDPGRRTVALCRCGRSGLKPFCDGSHRPARFRASGRDERPQPGATVAG